MRRESQSSEYDPVYAAGYDAGYCRGHKDGCDAAANWTPCAERMPDTNDDVYITYEYRGKLIAAVGFMGHSGAWYILEDDDGNEAKVNAIAWQPLPAPYRGDHA